MLVMQVLLIMLVMLYSNASNVGNPGNVCNAIPHTGIYNWQGVYHYTKITVVSVCVCV